MMPSEERPEQEPAPEGDPTLDQGLARPVAEYTGSPAQQTRETFWNFLDVLFMIGFAVPALLSGTMLSWLVFQAIPASAELPPLKAAQALTAQFLFWGIWFAVLWLLFRSRYNRPFWGSLAWGMPFRWGSSAAQGVLTALGVIVIGALLRPPEVEMPLMDMLQDPVSIFLIGIFAITLGPLAEELAFRGFFLPWLARPLGAVPAILLTGAVFACLHGPEYGWSWQHITLITLAGSAFGWVRYTTGSTAAATVMHAAYNLVFFLALLAQTRMDAL